MKVTLLSDLHFEFYTHCKSLFRILDKSLGTEYRSDEVIILAGDIGWPILLHRRPSFTYRKILQYFKNRFEYVILVSGNHEYYQRKRLGLCLQDFEHILTQLAHEEGVYYLQCQSVVIPAFDCTFLGCTGWTKPTSYVYRQMNDGKYIFHSRDELDSLHLSHRTWLEQALTQITTSKVVIITHHPPTAQLLQTPDSFVSGYSANFEDIIMKNKDIITAWFAGHTHEAKSITLEGVRCQVNPVGYKDEKRRTITDYESFEL